ncbi:MAG TPA: MBL fold metallo-hydrolase [Chloroflexota bacterium]|nr:MBL fold metallo-hydrolase [Chloroflexota bacterium]
MEIASGIHQLRAIACQVFALLEDDGVTLIDTGAPGSGWLILRQLRQSGRSPSDIKRIVLTHYHIDHRGTAAELRRASGADVLIHTSEATYLRGEMAYPNPIQTQPLAMLTTPLFSLMRGRPVPAIELHDGEVLPVMGGLRVIHATGHTRGSITLSLPGQGLLFAGDVMGFHRQELQEPDARVTENPTHARASLERLAALDIETICFSHFPPLREHARTRLELLVATWSPEFGERTWR